MSENKSGLSVAKTEVEGPVSECHRPHDGNDLGTTQSSDLETAQRCDLETSQRYDLETSQRYDLETGNNGNKEENRLKYDEGEDLALNGENRKKTFSFKQISHQKKILLVCMGFANFGSAACFSILAPFFPGKATDKGLSETTVGLIFSSHEFLIFVTAPIFGSFLVKLGVKRTFIVGITVCGISSVIFGLLDRVPDGVGFTVSCFIVRSIEAVGTSAFVTASFAIIAHEFPGHEATVFGSLEAFNGLGMMIGPGLGGALYLAGGYGLPFWILGVLLLACGIICMFCLPPLHDVGKPYSGSMFKLLTSPVVLVVGYLLFTAYTSLGFLDPTLANHYTKFKLSPFLIGLIFLIAPFIYAVEAPLVGWLSDKKGHTNSIMMFGHIGSVLAFLLLGPAPFLPFLPFELWSQIIALVAIGILIGCIVIPSFKAVLKGAQDIGMPDDFNTFGVVSGFVNSTMSLGATVGPLAGGVLVDQIQFAWTSSIVALMYLISSLVLMIYILIDKYYIQPKKSVMYDRIHDAVQLHEISSRQDS